jgi:negative regulator of replication initiation
MKGPFWVLANTNTQKAALIILIIFSHQGVKFLGFWILGTSAV